MYHFLNSRCYMEAVAKSPLDAIKALKDLEDLKDLKDRHRDRLCKYK